MADGEQWRVWAWFWTAPKPKKHTDYATKAEAESAAEALNASPSGQYTDYFVEEMNRGKTDVQLEARRG